MSDENPNCECAVCRLTGQMSRDEAFALMFAKLKGLVEMMGWAPMSILESEEERRYTYTLGMTAQGDYDLLVVGLPPETCVTMIQAVLSNDPKFEDGEIFDFGKIKLKLSKPIFEVRDEDIKFSQIYQEQLNPDQPTRWLQILWPDPSLKHPGDEGYDDVCFGQEIVKPLTSAGQVLH